ncbi:hypothetical protein GF337_10350, partial [candidate division KSB1 bacterium]|nr:hypothetical protein [candidate division KSB1 bacterium]
VNYGSMMPENHVLENEHLRVEFNPNGTFDLTHKSTGKTFPSCHFFEDDAEAGDPWTRIEPLQNRKVSSLGSAAKISIVENGELQSTVKVELEMQIPKSLTSDKGKRSDELVGLPITSLITLRKGSPRLDIMMHFENHARDHRLRVCFPTAMKASTVDVETAFDVVSRDIELPDTRDWVEPVTGTQPHLSFFDLSDKKSGLAVISHGLVEYEVQDNESRTMILTLLKGVRYPKVGLPMDRVERLEQSGSQCPGKHTCSYSLFPHEGDWQQGQVHQYTYRHFTPVKLAQCGISGGDLPVTSGLLKIEPEALVLSALKKCDTRDSVILRFFNPTSKEFDANINFRQPLKQVFKTILNEEREDEIPVTKSGAVFLKVAHKKIITLECIFE